MESPPKRMTRARAAAKAGESSGTVKTAKIVTAAARAKSTATSSTRSTAAKRKTRADEQEDEEEAVHESAPVRKTRGRPKKTEVDELAEQPEERPKATRGRPPKKAAVDTSSTSQPAPVKATRGRPRKVVVETPAEEEEQETAAAPEPVKKATRGKAGAATKVKKTVKFEEPDKENMEPQTKAKEPATTGLRGRPARRGTATARTTTTRTAVSRSTVTAKKPLSPKKVTQMPVSRADESEDELAGGSTPVKTLMRRPVKLPAKKNQPPPPEETVDSTIVVDMAINPPEFPSITLGSPAKRLPSSPFKDTLKSPAKRIGPIALPGSALKPNNTSPQQGNNSPFKASLLQSAAKRPQSPIKGLNFGSSMKMQQSQSAMKASLLLSPAKRAIPGLKPLTEPRQRDLPNLTGSPIMKPLVSTPTPATTGRPSDKLMSEEQPAVVLGRLDDDDVFGAPIERLDFNGRLSTVLPRHADPALNTDMAVVEEESAETEMALIEDAETEVPAEEQQVEQPEIPEEVTEAEEVVEAAEPIDEDLTEEEVEDEQEPIPTEDPEPIRGPMFQLREKDLNPCHDMGFESEDELTAAFNMPTTPTANVRKTPKVSRMSMGNFDALADQLGSWKAHSPVKEASKKAATPKQADASVVQPSPVVNSFFEDEMSVRPEPSAEAQQQEGDAAEEEFGDVEEPSFEDIMVTDEDVALAQEAQEMSMMEPEEVENVVGTAGQEDLMDDTLSEASQEYGDENDQPTSVNSLAPPPVTPVRPIMKTFNTTTKVPLKPADESTPSPLKKRSYSASRVIPRRPSGLTRNATVISYSPTKERHSLAGGELEERASSAPPTTPEPVTPSKSDLWSSMGTPARTPRRDLNPALLRGAVVYVDVHTSEGADASGIFVELLTQMGAKCMKSWTWNPGHGHSGEASSSKIGITHVVYKDGGKRTLEKVRESGGVVQCVGVSWVLDCERENQWLDEAPYCIDTRIVPRGGARRRKSMEPRALANMNGTLVSSNAGSSPTKQAQTAPNTPMNRRDSTVWMFTPSDQGEDEDRDEDDEDHEWTNAILTPVPKTPAPDAVARYAAALGPETPSGYDDDDDEDDLAGSPTQQNLLMRTCPPKTNPFRDLGAGLLSQDKDEQVLLRLMAARRKSLQFAPKIGSPLSRAW